MGIHLICIVLQEFHDVGVQHVELVELSDSRQENSQIRELSVLLQGILLHLLERDLEFRVVFRHFLHIQFRSLSDLVRNNLQLLHEVLFLFLFLLLKLFLLFLLLRQRNLSQCIDTHLSLYCSLSLYAYYNNIL